METQDEHLIFDINNQGHQEVKDFLQHCRLLQYLEVFIAEGFESLPSLIEVTEDDMIAMGVKRGHRRLIQRDIVTTRGMSYNIQSPPYTDKIDSHHHRFKTSMVFYQPPEGNHQHQHYYRPEHQHSPSSVNNVPSTTILNISSPTSVEAGLSSTDSSSSCTNSNNSTDKLHNSPSSSSSSSDNNNNNNNNNMIIQHQAKRKYRKRPKPDLNAPAKPPSAYVMFSNHLRAEMKNQNLTFAEISKIIGEKWKSLSAEKKDGYELTAMQAKDAYLIEMQQYARTPEYRRYRDYLKNFKEKQAVAHQLTLRQSRRRYSNRLESPSSGESLMDSSSNSIEPSDSGIQTGTDISESSSSNDNTIGTDPQGQMFLMKLPQQSSAVCDSNNLIRQNNQDKIDNKTKNKVLSIESEKNNNYSLILSSLSFKLDNINSSKNNNNNNSNNNNGSTITNKSHITISTFQQNRIRPVCSESCIPMNKQQNTTTEPSSAITTVTRTTLRLRRHSF
ncbi:hypothetical protein BDC45DRAFT_521414 [Circinella umbellata]|nr:hypothetical protein BDC45DRAFT_521414 [Circinella umbellata]